MFEIKTQAETSKRQKNEYRATCGVGSTRRGREGEREKGCGRKEKEKVEGYAG